MKQSNIIIITRKSDISKQLRYTIDKLSTTETVTLSASVENADIFSQIINVLKLLNCKVSAVNTGHLKSSGQHVPIIRCSVNSNNLEFSTEFKYTK